MLSEYDKKCPVKLRNVTSGDVTFCDSQFIQQQEDILGTTVPPWVN